MKKLIEKLKSMKKSQIAIIAGAVVLVIAAIVVAVVLITGKGHSSSNNGTDESKGDDNEVAKDTYMAADSFGCPFSDTITKIREVIVNG